MSDVPVVSVGAISRRDGETVNPSDRLSSRASGLDHVISYPCHIPGVDNNGHASADRRVVHVVVTRRNQRRVIAARLDVSHGLALDTTDISGIIF